VRARRPGPAPAAAALTGLRARKVNYDQAHAPLDGRPAGHWHVDSAETAIGREPPGPPVPGGPFETACLLVRRYEFSDPAILRAVYRAGDELLGRDMLLEGRFYGLRFYLGVRVTRVIDETQGTGPAATRVWGWSYQTLEGHLEQGRLTYEVLKNTTSGEVSFRVSGYSRRAPIPNPLIRWGFRLFGRWTQVRFYASVQHRMRRLVQASQHGAALPGPTVGTGGIVIAPSGATAHPLERLAHPSRHPGR
jgi:uncharacterized protein (UPF0548 family)